MSDSVFDDRLINRSSNTAYPNIQVIRIMDNTQDNVKTQQERVVECKEHQSDDRC